MKVVQKDNIWMLIADSPMPIRRYYPSNRHYTELSQSPVRFGHRVNPTPPEALGHNYKYP